MLSADGGACPARLPVGEEEGSAAVGLGTEMPVSAEPLECQGQQTVQPSCCFRLELHPSARVSEGTQRSKSESNGVRQGTGRCSDLCCVRQHLVLLTWLAPEEGRMQPLKVKDCGLVRAAAHRAGLGLVPWRV